MDGYPLIENHGLIGDLQTAALLMGTPSRVVIHNAGARFDVRGLTPRRTKLGAREIVDELLRVTY